MANTLLKLNNFIEKAKTKHGNKYDYSLVNYINNTVKVKIRDVETGLIFEQTPQSHLKSKFPQHLSKNTPLDTDTFIKKAISKHGDKYNYSLVEYTGCFNKVKIICSIHGVFEQAAHVHLSGSGCRKCNLGSEKKTTEQFITEAKTIHGDRYDYSLVDYKGSHTNVKIICERHGIFEQSPSNHLKGSNCKACSLEDFCTEEEFIKKANLIHNNKYDYSLINYKLAHDKVKIICPIHGEFTQLAYGHLASKGCPKCANQYSTQHEHIKYIITQYNINFEENSRSIIPPLELDFYLPDYKIGIEINGIYWHSELQGKDKNYHLNKTNLCKEKGIRLIHINENEFVNSLPIIKSKLNSILGINKRKIYGRKCVVKEIDTKLKSKFLNKYHLQGNDKASIKLGLFYNNHLISVMTFCKRRVALGKKKTQEGEYELSRYCGNFNFYVIGGASKLLKYFERNYNPTKIVTYADKRWSTGDLYFKLGFTHTHDSKPNYWYFSRCDRYNLKHRFNFRKNVISKKLDKFDPQKTEWENMKDNGWNRIWDCGNMVFEKSLLT
jgi:hypothetical protein